MNKSYFIFLIILLFFVGITSAAEVVEESGSEYGQKEIEIIQGVLDFDGFLVFALSIVSFVFIFISRKNFCKPVVLLLISIGILVIGVNISFGDFWDPVSLHNSFIDDLEDLFEIIAFAIFAVAGWMAFSLVEMGVRVKGNENKKQAAS